MASTKLPNLTALTTVADGDELYINDVSDTTDGASGTNKKITRAVLLDSLTITTPSITTPKIITSLNDANGNEVIITPATASAINEVTVTNAAASGVPQIASTGGDTNIHLDLRGKGNALVKTEVLRQDDTSNGYHVNSVILTGWGYWTGDGSTKRAAKTVTFGITFSAAPIVIFGGLGYLGSNPAAIGDLTAIAASIGDLSFTYAATDVTTTTFVAEITNAGSVLTATWRLGFSWICIGQLNP